MQKKKFMLLSTSLILALMLVGFAYAHWSKTITINGSVDTGIVDLIILRAQDDDNGIDPDYNKDVADTTVQIDPQDPEKLIVTITNAYPSYHVYIDLTVRNVGTIPVKLKEFITDAPNCITVQIWNGIGEQIDPYSWGGTPDKYQKDYTMYVHVEQCAEKGATYTFTIELVYWNWNEVQ